VSRLHLWVSAVWVFLIITQIREKDRRCLGEIFWRNIVMAIKIGMNLSQGEMQLDVPKVRSRGL